MNYAKVFGYNALTINTPAANGLTFLQKWKLTFAEPALAVQTL
jgi:hypothetical protein